MANRSDWLNEPGTLAEVIGPLVAAWMKQRDGLTRGRIDGSDITSFVAVAQHAGKRQIVRQCSASVLPADDVIYLVRESGIFFVDEAIFAAMLRASGNRSP